MKAFITGATGFIGSHLARKLHEQNWDVGILRHTRDLEGLEGIRVFQGDVSDRDSLKGLFNGTEVLFHLAAALGATRISPQEFFQINAQGTQNVLEAAAEAGVPRMVHFSSAGVIGSVRENEPVGEDYAPSPRDVYDKTKRKGEEIALQFAKKGTDVVVIRPGWVYGPGDRRTFKLIKAVASKKFLLVTRGTVRQTPVYIDDLIQGILLCADKGKTGEIYHLAGNEVLTVEQITGLIARATGVPLTRFPLPTFALRVAAWKMEKAFSLLGREAPLTRGKLAFFIHPKPLSIRKAGAYLEYAPQWNFETGIATAVSWYREHGWLPPAI